MTNEDTVSLDTLNEEFLEQLGMTFQAASQDNAGCYLQARSGTWMSPQVITTIVTNILNALGYDVPEEAWKEPQAKDVEDGE